MMATGESGKSEPVLTSCAAENPSCEPAAQRVSSHPACDGNPDAGPARPGGVLNHFARSRMLMIGWGLLGLLAVARWLEPAASGMGTHQQLGLPACTTVTLFNVRCPSCGMTTSWALSILYSRFILFNFHKYI